MKQYAHISGGAVDEIITPPLAEVDMYDPPAEDGGDPTLAVKAGDQIPMDRCYHPLFVADCREVPPGTSVSTGDTWTEGGGFGPPPPPPEPPAVTADQAKAHRDVLLTAANLRKGALQDAVDIGEATPAEEALLLKYKQYTVKLTRIEQQPGFPASVAWPVAPE